jgi:DNA-binding FadR family transcriptional regulator
VYPTRLGRLKPYERVFEVLKDRAKQLPPGSHLGREDDLCLELGVGKWSLRHALELMRLDGMAVTIVGQGTFTVETRHTS